MDRNIFERNAAALRKLYDEIEVTVASRHLDEEHQALWQGACRRFHESFDSLAFPGGLERELGLLKTGNPEAVEMAVRFLEADAWFFRSGYIKEDLLRRLRHVRLENDQKNRLRAIILARIDNGAGREFRKYAQLARLLITSQFRAAIEQRTDSIDSQAASRAALVLRSIDS